MTSPIHPADRTRLVTPADADPAPPAATVRLAGGVLAGGAVAWATVLVLVGDRVLEGIQPVDSITGAVYVLGLAGVMVVLARAGATGRRAGRFLPLIAAPVLLGAALLNLLSLGYATYDDLPVGLQILDVCWPLGQVLVLVVGIAVARAGRVHGVVRWLPLVCGLWFPVSTVAQIVLGPSDSVVVSAAWLLLGPAVLGVRLVARPADLAAPRAADAS